MAFENAGSEAGRIFLQLGRRRTTTELEGRKTTIGAHGDDSRERDGRRMNGRGGGRKEGCRRVWEVDG